MHRLIDCKEETHMFKMLVRCGIAALLAVLGSGATAQDPKKPIYVGQVSPLTGPASSVGVPLTQGASLLVRKVNANGGINGSTLKLLDKDDGFDPKRTVGAVTELLADKERPIVALINVVGSSQNGDLVSQGLLASNDLSIVGAFTGSTRPRFFGLHIFWQWQAQPCPAAPVKTAAAPLTN
jgi:hypothetical protein